MNDKAVLPVPNEKIELVYDELHKLEEIAIHDLVIDKDMGNNFDNCNKIYKWAKYYNKWKKIHQSTDAEFKRIKSIRYFALKEASIYNMTDKEIIMKLDSDPILISYNALLDSMDITVEFIKKIQGLLDNQRYDIKEKFAYMRFLNGEDF